MPGISIDQERERQVSFRSLSIFKFVVQPRLPPTVWWKNYLDDLEKRDSLLCVTCSSLRSSIRCGGKTDPERKAVAKRKRLLQKQLQSHRYSYLVAFTCSRESDCNVQTVPVLSLSPFLTFPPPLAPAPHSDEKEEKEEQPVEVPLEVWHKERDRHADWEDAGEECDEYVLPNDEQETGRVSQPGAKSKAITKG